MEAENRKLTLRELAEDLNIDPSNQVGLVSDLKLQNRCQKISILPKKKYYIETVAGAKMWIYDHDTQSSH